MMPSPASTSRYPGMVWVAGGSFEMGDTVYPEEQPLRHTTVSGFWMDRTEVSNAAFAEFVVATGYVTVAERVVDAVLRPDVPRHLREPGAVVFVSPANVNGQGDIRQWWRYTAGANWRHPGGPATDIVGRESFPVVTVTWEDAQAYARWKGRTLPSEAQWEWAARAGQPGTARDPAQPKFANTWQGLFPVLNSGDDGHVGLAPVGCYPPNAAGLFDMIGNAWELTADVYIPTHSDPALATQRHVIKGGSYLCAANYCMRYRTGARQGQEDDLGTGHVGFRTILLAPGP